MWRRWLKGGESVRDGREASSERKSDLERLSRSLKELSERHTDSVRASTPV